MTTPTLENCGKQQSYSWLHDVPFETDCATRRPASRLLKRYPLGVDLGNTIASLTALEARRVHKLLSDMRTYNKTQSMSELHPKLVRT